MSLATNDQHSIAADRDKRCKTQVRLPTDLCFAVHSAPVLPRAG